MAKELGLETRERWENDSEMLGSPPLRRVASAPRGPSTAAEQSSAQQERGEGEERGEAGKTGICCCWFQQHGWSKNLGLETGSWTSPLLSVYPNRWRVMERMGKRQRRGTEQEIVRGLFLLYGTKQTPPLSQCHSSLACHIFSLPSSTTVRSPASSVSLSTV